MMWAQNIRSVRGSFSRAAAPEGGAQRWVRGCAQVLAVLATPLCAQDLPSGQTVTLNEVLIDDVAGEAWLRFRFLAPEIARDGGRITFEDAAPDMDKLCNVTALGYMAEAGLTAEKIAISLSDRAVPFGAPDPDATQFIEVYSVEDGRCIWEAF